MPTHLVTRDPQIMGGTPVFAGTRVPVQTLLDYLEAGDSIDEFLAGFPGVQRDQVVEFLGNERLDYTSFFRQLSDAARGEADPPFGDWLARWRSLGPDADAMDRVNPIYIPRNHLVEEALAAATAGDLDPLEGLLTVVTSPYEQRPGFERYAEPAPEEFFRPERKHVDAPS